MILRYQHVPWSLINKEVVCQVIKMKRITDIKEYRTMGLFGARVPLSFPTLLHLQPWKIKIFGEKKGGDPRALHFKMLSGGGEEGKEGKAIIFIISLFQGCGNKFPQTACLKTTEFILPQLCRPEVCQRDWFLLEEPGENISCFSLSSWWLPAILAIRGSQTTLQSLLPSLNAVLYGPSLCPNFPPLIRTPVTGQSPPNTV